VRRPVHRFAREDTIAAALPQVLQALPVGARVTSSACTGVMYAALDADAAGTVELTGLRAAVRPYDGSVVVLDAASAASCASATAKARKTSSAPSAWS
jgi:hypothetical protein